MVPHKVSLPPSSNIKNITELDKDSFLLSYWFFTIRVDSWLYEVIGTEIFQIKTLP